MTEGVCCDQTRSQARQPGACVFYVAMALRVGEAALFHATHMAATVIESYAANARI